jgi:hypothetical protein
MSTIIRIFAASVNIPNMSSAAFASEEEAQAHATSLSLPERQYEIVRRKDRDSDQ